MPKITRFERLCQTIVVLIGVRCGFANRNLPIGADGLAYLDLAHAYLAHHWGIAVNGYWGPLYACLLAVGMRLFRPSFQAELAVVRGTNVAIFIFALYAFSRCWRAAADWSRRIHEGISLADVSPRGWLLLGYLLFLLKFVWFVEKVNPDILVGGIVFAVTALLFKLNDGEEHSVATYARLGALLALGYYAKAILLYFALFVLGGIVVQGIQSRRYQKSLAAILVFLGLVLPYQAVLSRTLGHVSVGDSGKLNYAWFVDGPETKTWMQGLDRGAPIPFYPGRVVLESPRVFRVPLLAEVTYAPWYDAARFDRHTRASFDLRGQLRQLGINSKQLKEQLFGAESSFLVSLIILAWSTGKNYLRHLAAAWFCVLPASLVVGMYLLVHLVARFLLGFSLTLWAATFASVSLARDSQAMARRVLVSGIFVFAASVSPGLLHYMVSQHSESVESDRIIAEALPSYGLRSGDLVASVGDGQEAYWAHDAGLSVVAEIWTMDEDPFWLGSHEAQQAVLRSMAESGAKAVVWRRDSDRACPDTWVPLPQLSGCIVALR